MQLNDLDRLIADMAEEGASGQSDEYARGLMAEGARVVKLAFALKSIVGMEGQDEMTDALFVGRALNLAHDALECLKRQSPEDLALSIINNCGGSSPDFVTEYIAAAIRKDRLFERNQS